MSNAKKAAAPPAGEEPAPKKGKGKLIIIAVAALVVLAGGGGAAAYFLGLFGGQATATAPAAEHGEAAAAGDGHGGPAAAGAGAPAAADHAAAATAPPSFVELPEMLVNLRTSAKRMRFLKLKVSLEVRDEKAIEQVKLLTPRILDGFQLYLRALDVDEVDGSKGMQTLKEELMARINQAIAPTRVSDVLFKEMLVQ